MVRSWRGRVLSCATLAFLGAGWFVVASALADQKAPNPEAPEAKKAPEAKTAPEAEKPGAPPGPFAAEEVALRGGDLNAAREAVRALAAAKSPAATDVLMDALAVGLHPEVLEVALGESVRAGGAAAFDTVRFYSNYRRPSVRAAAVAALALVPDRRARPLVVAALRDVRAAVRTAAADACVRNQWREAVPVLLALFDRRDAMAVAPLAELADAETARLVGERIGAVPDDHLVAALAAILARPDFGPDEIREEVVRTLAKVPGEAAVAALVTYASSEELPGTEESRSLAERLVGDRMGGAP